MKIAKPLSSLFIILIILLYSTQCEQPNYNINDPVIQSIPSQAHTISATSKQTIKLQLHKTLYSAGGLILQRPINPETAKTTFQTNPEQFKNSYSCKLNDPDIRTVQFFSKSIETSNENVKDYIVHHRTNLLFLRTASKFQIYNLGIISDKISFMWANPLATPSFIVSIKIPQDLLGSTVIDSQTNTLIPELPIKFVKIGSKIAVTNGQVMYYFQIQQGHNITLVLWTSQLMDPKQKYIVRQALFIRQTLFLMGINFYRIFKYTQGTQIQFNPISLKLKDDEIRKYLGQGQFVDAIWQPQNPDHLYILTNIEGIIQVRNFQSQNKPLKVVKHGFRLGNHRSFMRFDNVFEVAFHLQGQRDKKVAEFLYIEPKTEEAESAIVLNRYYDKVGMAKDIDYYMGQLVITGDEEMHIYGPAVNRKILMMENIGEFPYVAPAKQTRFVQVLNQQSEEMKTALLLIRNTGFSIVKSFRVPTYITCYFNESATIIVKTVGTCPNVTAHSLLTTVCEYTDIYDIAFEKSFSAKQALIVTIAVIIGIFIFSCLITIFCANRIKQAYEHISDLDEKQEMIKKKKGNKKVPVDPNSIQEMQNNQDKQASIDTYPAPSDQKLDLQ